MTIKFGTDGWRGRIAEDYTFENVRRCAQAFARYMLSEGHTGESIVVGYDRRFASKRFAMAVSEVLALNGLRVWMTDSATPTPVIAYAVIDKQAVGAINITASHNPPSDNGFKVRDHTGGAIAPEGLLAIESHIPPPGSVDHTPFNLAKEAGNVQVFDAAPAYIEHLKELIDLEPIKDAGFRIMVDSMWGNGAGWFPRLLQGGRTEIFEVHTDHNPLFPEMDRPEPIPPNVDVGLRASLDKQADICIITDGDADRLGVGDENGQFINQLRVFGLLAYYLLDLRGQRGPIVRTLSTTSILDKLGHLYDVPVYETGVGFKYIAPKMTSTNALIGGEESGGFAFQNHVPERDGILAGLFILDLMRSLGQRPSELISTLFTIIGRQSHYHRIDSDFPPEQKESIMARVDNAAPESIGGLSLKTVDKTDGYKFKLEGGSWLLIRFSGTEPIIRVYCETDDESRVYPILQDGLHIAGLQ